MKVEVIAHRNPFVVPQKRNSFDLEIFFKIELQNM